MIVVHLVGQKRCCPPERRDNKSSWLCVSLLSGESALPEFGVTRDRVCLWPSEQLFEVSHCSLIFLCINLLMKKEIQFPVLPERSTREMPRPIFCFGGGIESSLSRLRSLSHGSAFEFSEVSVFKRSLFCHDQLVKGRSPRSQPLNISPKSPVKPQSVRVQSRSQTMRKNTLGISHVDDSLCSLCIFCNLLLYI